MRLGGIKFCWSETNKKYQLVKCNQDGVTEFVVAFFDRHKEGYDMRTVGSRFFEVGVDACRVASFAIEFLNKSFGSDFDDGLLDNPLRKN